MVGALLGLAGLAGGLTLGRGLRPTQPANTPVVNNPAANAPVANSAVERPAPEAIPPAPVQADATASLQTEIARLRAAREEDQARLARLAQAQATAEADLASLRRDLAAARREPPQAAPPVPAPAQVAAPAAPRPARAEAAPANGQPRVFIHIRAGSNAGAEAAASLAQPLREAGFELGDLRPVPSTPSQRVVRYFHAEDAAAAARLAGRLGRGWAIQDFRSYEPAPASQTLEIWLPER